MQNMAYAKFRESKTLAKNSEFTVLSIEPYLANTRSIFLPIDHLFSYFNSWKFSLFFQPWLSPCI